MAGKYVSSNKTRNCTALCWLVTKYRPKLKIYLQDKISGWIIYKILFWNHTLKKTNRNECLQKYTSMNWGLQFSLPKQFLITENEMSWILKTHWKSKNKMAKKIFALFTLQRPHLGFVSFFDYQHIQLHACKTTVTHYFFSVC